MKLLAAVLLALSIMFSSSGSVFAGGIGQSGCKYLSKIAKCTVFATDEGVECIFQELSQGKPSGACLGTLCTAAQFDCCACMHYSDACNAAKDMTPDNLKKCEGGLKAWIASNIRESSPN